MNDHHQDNGSFNHRVYGTPPPAAQSSLSPAIGEFAIQQMGKLQAEHEALYQALKKLTDALDSGSTTVPHHALHARDVLRRVGAGRRRTGVEVLR